MNSKKIEESVIFCQSSNSLPGNIGGLLVWGNAGINTWIDFFSLQLQEDKISYYLGPVGRDNSSIDLHIWKRNLPTS